MPDIKIYVSDDIYIKWLNETPDTQKKIRSKMLQFVKEAVNEG